MNTTTTPKTTMSLTDALVSEVTAFGTLAELEAACRDGYVPSLYPMRGRAKWVRASNGRRAALVDTLTALGYRVWVGG
jgi:hypothetical protein